MVFTKTCASILKCLKHIVKYVNIFNIIVQRTHNLYRDSTDFFGTANLIRNMILSGTKHKHFWESC